ncbi:hypothetical protein IAT38_004984 [Cryptococcus sp. DSM 104549]
MLQSLIITIFASFGALLNQLYYAPGHLSILPLSLNASRNRTAPLLFQNISIGEPDLGHRVVLAPLTRKRADSEGVLGWMGEEYYRQRASQGGLIITEATVVAEEAGGQDRVPGIWSTEQISAWKNITDAVHDRGGIIYCQLWALGRVADPAYTPDGRVYAPSPIPYVPHNGHPPHANQLAVMSEEDIDRFVEHFTRAGRSALEAGFDGVELQAGDGYLIDQFLQTASNNRTDAYGGSLENRTRFLHRIITAISANIWLSRVGIRLSPFSTLHGMRMANPLDTVLPLVQSLIDLYPDLSYIRLIEGEGAEDLDPLRKVVNEVVGDTKVIVGGGYSPKKALEHAEKTGDLVSFGRWFISNPDLPERIKEGHKLAKWDESTFYTHGAEGYIE